MALYLSPLVDVNEIDLSTTIPAVATSIGVLVLRNTWKGPELKRQLINNIDELIEVFGTGDGSDPQPGVGYVDMVSNLVRRPQYYEGRKVFNESCIGVYLC